MLRLWRLCALLLILALAACQRDDAAPTSPPPGVPTAAPTLAPRPTAAPPVTAVAQPTASPSALTLWVVAQGAELDALRRLVDDLATASGAQVLVVGKTADALVADIRADTLAGLPPPDLIWGTQDELGLLMRGDLLQPAADGLSEQAFLPATLAGAQLDGQRWGTPVAAQSALLLLYNRKLVSAPPRTTDELIARARAQTGGGTVGLVAAWAEPRWFVAWLTGMGGGALGPDGRPALDTPQTIAALNLLKELRVAGPPPPSTYEEGVDLFRQGRAAFAIDGDWSLDSYREYSDTLDLGVAPLPVVPSTGRVAAGPLGGIYLMYGSLLADARRDQAFALGRALAGPAAQLRVAGELRRLPALVAALGDPAVAADPALAAIAAQAPGAPGLPPTGALRCAWDAIGSQLAPVLLGDQTQAEAARAMQAAADACVQGG